MGEVPTFKKLNLANRIKDQRINTTWAWVSNTIQINPERGIIIAAILPNSNYPRSVRGCTPDNLCSCSPPRSWPSESWLHKFPDSFTLPKFGGLWGVDGNLVQCSLQAKPWKGVCARARTCAEEMSPSLNIPLPVLPDKLASHCKGNLSINSLNLDLFLRPSSVKKGEQNDRRAIQRPFSGTCDR